MLDISSAIDYSHSVWLLAKCAEQLESSEQVCACLAHNNYTVPLVMCIS